MPVRVKKTSGEANAPNQRLDPLKGSTLGPDSIRTEKLEGTVMAGLVPAMSVFSARSQAAAARLTAASASVVRLSSVFFSSCKV
jgi:hypothetical protein